MRSVWPAGQVVEAACMSSAYEPPTHRAPLDGCRCGLYARTTLDGCFDEYPYYPVYGYSMPTRAFMATGAVLMWGITLRGRRVIRSQYSRVLCLTERPDIWASRTGPLFPSAIVTETVAARHQTLEAICREYGVPMVPFRSMERYVAEFGELSERPDAAA
ncbi:MAG: hypothetical protein JWM18_2388 [Chloroflexi bacterium]|nr:hypothetical protein [Chloroflexota bacterium]